MLETNVSHSDAAAHFGVSRLTITRLARCYKAAGMAADRPLSGRPRTTTRRQDNHIWASHDVASKQRRQLPWQPAEGTITGLEFRLSETDLQSKELKPNVHTMESN